MRLDKYLCELGIGSRSDVKKLISKGRVKINGNIVKDAGAKLSEESDKVSVDDRELSYVRFEYYMLNKPKGYVSASKADLRNKDEKCVIDLIDTKIRKDLFPAGRLDKDTEGLLLITNDGALSHRLLSPKHHVDKTYYVELSDKLSEQNAETIMKGVDIGDEKPTMPCTIERLDDNSCNIVIQEGRYHQVKRMFETQGLTVTYLKRLKMGSLVLDERLKLGEYRRLSEEELEELKNL
ncbi:MAG: pseudouridine synthase [Eubacteriales bacterium]|nr:pseudouridine synthase [Eubacteriales bacterium]